MSVADLADPRRRSRGPEQPRLPLALLPTPLVPAPRLAAALGPGCPPLWIKRDDLTGFGVAGNKARALEFLLGAAVAEGADVLVAAGSPSSNFCAAAALAAARAGMACELLFAGPATGVNTALARAAGAVLHPGAAPRREDLDAAVSAHARGLRAAGRRPYAVPRGGATAVGALGYAQASTEIADQCTEAGIVPALLVTATGSGGTQAGLVTGQVGSGLPWSTVGASVSRDVAQIAEVVWAVATGCARLLGTTAPRRTDVCVRDLRGAGFGVASAADRVSAELALTHEGLLLDDYYGAKAMTLLRTMIADGVPGPIVFLHTGGVAAALGALQ